MHIYRTAVAKVVKAPHLIQQLVAGKYPVGGRGQVVQKLQLLRRRIHPLAIHQQLVGIQVDHQLIKAELLVLLFLLLAGAAHHRVDAGQNLFHLKGFYNIVVCSALQPGDLILCLTFGCKHNDRCSTLLPDLLQYGPAIHHRQHNIKQNQSRLEGAEILHALASVFGYFGLKTFLFQIQMEQLSNIAVILYDQNLLRHR